MRMPLTSAGRGACQKSESQRNEDVCDRETEERIDETVNRDRHRRGLPGIESAQPEGKKPQSPADLANGRVLIAGATLGNRT